jgi:hypothetical protein
MRSKILIYNIITVLLLMIIGCTKDDIDSEIDTKEQKRVGFELLEIVSPNEILVWINDEDLSQEEFDYIQLPLNWRKNEPREGEPDSATFSRSPKAAQDGVFTRENHFGYRWLFNAQVVQTNVQLTDNLNGLLVGNYIAKYHKVQFKAGRTLHILISPDGEEYVRISRDANRTTDTPIIPDTWKIEERIISEVLTLDLPNPTLNIRAQNNQDSFQGPVSF